MAWVIDAVILIALAGALVYAPFGILIWYLGRKWQRQKEEEWGRRS